MEKVTIILGRQEIEIECDQDPISYEHGGYVIHIDKFKWDKMDIIIKEA